MQKVARSAIAVFFLSSAVYLPNGSAQSGSFGTTLTDLWWDPNESGWGVTVDNQMDVMFLTFFIYKADSSPYWVTATLNRVTPGNGVTVPVTFSGDVYETRGSYYGAPFNASQTAYRKVGTATFAVPTDLARATLTYTIDGVTVQKPNLERQTLRNINFQGSYYGGVAYATSNCSPSSLNGQSISRNGSLTISQSGVSISMQIQADNGTCTLNGTYSQKGQLGYTAGGTFSCSDGTAGNFALGGMQWTITGMTASFAGNSQNCRLVGVLGGITGNHALP